MTSHWSWLLCALYLCSNVNSNQVVMISFDAFCYEYYKTLDIKSLKSIAAEGVFATTGVKPVFPSKTFPNHWSIATGLYPETHGIVNNRFYDPDLDDYFTTSKYDRKWFKGEPIWSTAKQQGKRVALLNWPGSEVNFGPNNADVSVPFMPPMRLKARFDTVYDWLTVDKFDLVLMYFYEPDYTGHQTGAGSLKVQEKIKQIDEQLINFMVRLSENQTLDTIDLIVVSDHGMTNTMDDPTINLWKFHNLTADAHHVDMTREMVGIWPHQGKTEIIYNAFKSVPKISVYYKDEVPDRFHYKSSNRIAPILIMADEGYVLTDNDKKEDQMRGIHGYDNELPSMKSIFFARGPGIKRSAPLLTYEAIDVYPLVCHLLDIKAAPNNGSLDKSMYFLSNESRPLHASISGLIVVLFLSQLIGGDSNV